MVCPALRPALPPALTGKLHQGCRCLQATVSPTQPTCLLPTPNYSFIPVDFPSDLTHSWSLGPHGLSYLPAPTPAIQPDTLDLAPSPLTSVTPSLHARSAAPPCSTLRAPQSKVTAKYHTTTTLGTYTTCEMHCLYVTHPAE